MTQPEQARQSARVMAAFSSFLIISVSVNVSVSVSAASLAGP